MQPFQRRLGHAEQQASNSSNEHCVFFHQAAFSKGRAGERGRIYAIYLISLRRADFLAEELNFSGGTFEFWRSACVKNIVGSIRLSLIWAIGFGSVYSIRDSDFLRMTLSRCCAERVASYRSLCW